MPPPSTSTREGSNLFAADEDNLEVVVGDEASAGGAEACPHPCQIVEVGFTDQPGLPALFGGARKQYVNLSRKRVRNGDAEIVSDNQIGRTPPIFVRVSPPCAKTVRLKLHRTLHRGGFPAGSATLSARERGLAHLQFARSERNHTTDANGVLLLEEGLPISALGGGEFKVKAALPGQGWVDGSNSVKVMRRLYLRPVRSYDAGRATAYGAMDAIRSQLSGLGIEVKRVSSSSTGHLGIAEEQSIRPTLDLIGRRALNSRTEHISDLRPHSVAVIIGEFLDDAVTMRSFDVDVKRGPDRQFPASVEVALRLTASGVTRQYRHIPLDDGTSFGGCTLSVGGTSVRIDRAQVSPLDRFVRRMTVDISGATARFPTQEVLRLRLRVKTIGGWAVGWAYTSHPVIYLNMLDPNTETVLTATKAEALMIHELGHKLHLAASGESGQPDLQAHHYPTGQDGTNHVGPHCSHGVPTGTLLNTDAARDASDCTMWGALKGVTLYCSECQTTLRKVNLGGGF